MVGGLRGFVDGSIRRDSALTRPTSTLRKLAALEALARVGAVEPDAARQHRHRAQPVADLGGARLVEHPAAHCRRLPDRDARLPRSSRSCAPGSTCRARRWASRPSTSDGLYWLMAAPDVNALRLVLHLIEFDLWRDDVPRLLRGALARQQRGAWETTVANAWGALAMRRFATAFEATPVTGATDAHAAPDAASSSTGARPRRRRRCTSRGRRSRPSCVIDHDGTGNPWLTIVVARRHPAHRAAVERLSHHQDRHAGRAAHAGRAQPSATACACASRSRRRAT